MAFGRGKSGELMSAATLMPQVAGGDALRPGDYTVRLRVIEAASLAALDTHGTSDPFVVVAVGGARQRTHVNKKCISCIWGTAMTFELPDLTPERAAHASVQFEVRDADAFKSDVIGVCELQLNYIWGCKDHATWHTWLALFERDAGRSAGGALLADGGTRGYLRVSASMFGPGRVDVLPVEPPREAEHDLRVLLPPSINLKVSMLCLDVILAEGLRPTFPSRIKLSAIVCIRFGGLELCSPPARVDMTHEPTEAGWDVKLRLPIALPATGDRIDLLVLEEGTGAVLASAAVALSKVPRRSGGLGEYDVYSKNSDVAYKKLHLYGPSLGSRAQVEAATARGEMPPTSWRGQLLCRLYRRPRTNEAPLTAATKVTRLRVKQAPEQLLNTDVHHLVVDVYMATGVPDGMGLALKVQVGNAEEQTKLLSSARTGSVEWNERLTLAGLVMPVDPQQQPAVFLTLCMGTGRYSPPVAFARISLERLNGFAASNSTRRRLRPKWVSLQALDAPAGAGAAPGGAGAQAQGGVLAQAGAGSGGHGTGMPSVEVLVEMRFGPKSRVPDGEGLGQLGLSIMAPAMMLVPVRACIYLCSDLPPTHKAGAISPFVVFRCGGSSARAKSVVRYHSTTPGFFEVLSLQLHLTVESATWPSAVLEVWDEGGGGGGGAGASASAGTNSQGQRFVGRVDVSLAHVARRLGTIALWDVPPMWYRLSARRQPAPTKAEPLDRARGPPGDAPGVLAAFAVGGFWRKDVDMDEEEEELAELAEAGGGERAKVGEGVARALAAALPRLGLSSASRDAQSGDPLRPRRIPCRLQLLVIGLRSARGTDLALLGVKEVALELEIQSGFDEVQRATACLAVERRPGAAGAGLDEPVLVTIDTHLPVDTALCPQMMVRVRGPGMLGGAFGFGAVLASGEVRVREELHAALERIQRGHAEAKRRRAKEKTLRYLLNSRMEAVLGRLRDLHVKGVEYAAVRRRRAARRATEGQEAAPAAEAAVAASCSGDESETSTEEGGDESAEDSADDGAEAGSEGRAIQSESWLKRLSFASSSAVGANGGRRLSNEERAHAEQLARDLEGSPSLRGHRRSDPGVHAPAGAGRGVTSFLQQPAGGVAAADAGSMRRARPLQRRLRQPEVSSFMRRREHYKRERDQYQLARDMARRSASRGREEGEGAAGSSAAAGAEGSALPRRWTRTRFAPGEGLLRARTVSPAARRPVTPSRRRTGVGEEGLTDPRVNGHKGASPAGEAKGAGARRGDGGSTSREKIKSPAGGIGTDKSRGQGGAKSSRKDSRGTLGALKAETNRAAGGGRGAAAHGAKKGPLALLQDGGSDSEGESDDSESDLAVGGAFAGSAWGQGPGSRSNAALASSGLQLVVDDDMVGDARLRERPSFPEELERASTLAGKMLVNAPYTTCTLAALRAGNVVPVAVLKHKLVVTPLDLPDHLRDAAYSQEARDKLRKAVFAASAVARAAPASAGEAAGQRDGAAAALPRMLALPPRGGDEPAAGGGGAGKGPVDVTALSLLDDHDLGAIAQRVPVHVRIHVLSGHQLNPNRSASRVTWGLPLASSAAALRTYLIVETKNQTDNDKLANRVVDGTLEPLFYRSFERRLLLPGDASVRITVMEAGQLYDEVIGSTVIDIEERWYSPEWRALKLKPLERRSLHRDGSPVPQGALELWVDVLTEEEASLVPFRDISLPQQENFEVRLIVWETKSLKKDDVIKSIDPYFRVSLRAQGTPAQMQMSDVHWSVIDGTAIFNWRFVFYIKLPQSSRHPFAGIYIDLQVWDNAILGEGELIAGTQVPLYRLCQNVWRMRDKLRQKRKGVAMDGRSADKAPNTRFWTPVFEGGGASGSEARSAGEVNISVEAMPEAVSLDLPAGTGRDLPNRNPVLPDPQRHETAIAARFAGIVREETRQAIIEGSKAVIENEVERQLRQLTPTRRRILAFSGVSGIVAFALLIILQVIANVVIIRLTVDTASYDRIVDSGAIQAEVV